MEEFDLDQRPIVGQSRDFWPIRYELVNGTDKEPLWNYIVRRWHYLGYGKGSGPRVKYLLWHKDTLIGAISFTSAALKLRDRDELFGASQKDFRAHILPHIANNNRFLILPWIRVRYLASRILSDILTTVRADWKNRYRTDIYAVETFVDLSKYKGTCYKAANWKLIGETRGYEKVGKEMVYHGNKKGIFFLIIKRKQLERLADQYRQPPAPIIESVYERSQETIEIMANHVWDYDLFEELGLTISELIITIPEALKIFLDLYDSAYTFRGQKDNLELYVIGLLSYIFGPKNIENIVMTLLGDGKKVRGQQNFIKDSKLDDAEVERITQEILHDFANDAGGMLTVDDSGCLKCGKNSFATAHQYIGSEGKTCNGQVGVYVGYSSSVGHGLMKASLYTPFSWFIEPEKLALWERNDAPEDLKFKTKPQIAVDLIKEVLAENPFTFKWFGCDCAYTCKIVLDCLPEGIHYFADVKSNHQVYLPGATEPISVSKAIKDDNSLWSECEKFIGAKGPVHREYKVLRVKESPEDKEDIWLFVRRNKNEECRYAISNAPADISEIELCAAADMRWSIEQSFRECKQCLGMDEYETRSYRGWHRHMELVLVAQLFLSIMRIKYSKPELILDDNFDNLRPNKIMDESPDPDTDVSDPPLPQKPAVQQEPTIADIVSLLIHNKRSPGSSQQSYAIRTEYFKVLTIYNTYNLVGASLTGNSDEVKRALNRVAYDVRRYWASINSYTLNYFIKKLQLQSQSHPNVPLLC